MTLIEIADQINGLFRDYGLTHDVVYVTDTENGQSNLTIHLDERENEPDPQKWRRTVVPSLPRIALVDADNESAMSLLLETLKFVFQVYFEVQPPRPAEQLRLF